VLNEDYIDEISSWCIATW